MAAPRGSVRGGAARLSLCGWLALFGLGSCAAAPAPSATLTEEQGRSVVWPTQLGWVSSARNSGELPGAIAVGGKASGRVLVYLEFPAPRPGVRPLRADLRLMVSGAPGEAITVELARSEAARGELRRWSDQPRARYPRRSLQLSSDDGPARLDVTELLRAERKPDEPVRLLLRAEPDAPEPLSIETGAAGGAAPRLEIYWE